MVPYLMGLHLTLDGWRGDRASDGWRAQDKTHDDGWGHVWHDSNHDLTQTVSEAAPKFVKIQPRLYWDIEALADFTQADHPPLIPVRPTNTVVCTGRLCTARSRVASGGNEPSPS